MSPGYRVPDPWALKHRRAIRWTGGAVAVGSLLAWATLPAVWNTPAVIALVADVLLWCWLSGKYSPHGRDYYNYLESWAKDTDMMGWLDAVDRDFIELWDLDTSKPGDFPNPGALIREVFVE